MTLKSTTRVRCDCCQDCMSERATLANDAPVNVDAFRHTLKREGWRQYGGLWACPDCRLLIRRGDRTRPDWMKGRF